MLRRCPKRIAGQRKNSLKTSAKVIRQSQCRISFWSTWQKSSGSRYSTKNGRMKADSSLLQKGALTFKEFNPLQLHPRQTFSKAYLKQRTKRTKNKCCLAKQKPKKYFRTTLPLKAALYHRRQVENNLNLNIQMNNLANDRWTEVGQKQRVTQNKIWNEKK